MAEGGLGRTFELRTRAQVRYVELSAYRGLDADGLPDGPPDRVLSCGEGLESRGCDIETERGQGVVTFTGSVPPADRYQTLRVVWAGATAEESTDWVTYQLPVSGAGRR